MAANQRADWKRVLLAAEGICGASKGRANAGFAFVAGCGDIDRRQCPTGPPYSLGWPRSPTNQPPPTAELPRRISVCLFVCFLFVFVFVVAVLLHLGLSFADTSSIGTGCEERRSELSSRARNGACGLRWQTVQH